MQKLPSLLRTGSVLRKIGREEGNKEKKEKSEKKQTR
jgi:hypothetical protein